MLYMLYNTLQWRDFKFEMKWLILRNIKTIKVKVQVDFQTSSILNSAGQFTSTTKCLRRFIFVFDYKSCKYLAKCLIIQSENQIATVFTLIFIQCVMSKREIRKTVCFIYFNTVCYSKL